MHNVCHYRQKKHMWLVAIHTTLSAFMHVLLLHYSFIGYYNCTRIYALSKCLFSKFHKCTSFECLLQGLMATVIKQDCVDQCRACGSQIYSQWGRSACAAMVTVVDSSVCLSVCLLTSTIVSIMGEEVS